MIVSYIEKVIKNEFVNIVRKKIKIKETEVYMDSTEKIEKYMQPMQHMEISIALSSD